MAHGMNVDLNDFAKRMDKMFNELESDNLLKECQKTAKKVCNEQKKVVKASANADIKRNRYNYVNNFVTLPLNKKDGSKGAAIWNKQYTLSHLVEDAHKLVPYGHTNNNYHFFKKNVPTANEEFAKGCRENILKILRNI